MNGFIDYFPIVPDQYWIFGADTEIKEVKIPDINISAYILI